MVSFSAQFLFTKLNYIIWNLNMNRNWWVGKYEEEYFIFILKNVFLNRNVLIRAWTCSFAKCTNNFFSYSIFRAVVFLPNSAIKYYTTNNKSSFHVHKSSSKLPTSSIGKTARSPAELWKALYLRIFHYYFVLKQLDEGFSIPPAQPGNFSSCP